MKYGGRNYIVWLILEAANAIGAIKMNLMNRACLSPSELGDIGIAFD